jgi:hypothetical protein
MKIAKDVFRGVGHAKKYGHVPRFFFSTLQAILLLTPAMIIKGIFDRWGLRRTAAEVYVFVKAFILLLILFLGGSSHVVSFGFTAFVLSELLLYLFGLIFLHKFWGPVTSLERSIFLMLINFLEIVVGFAIIYIYTSSISNGPDILSNPLDALYFSVVTITTLGYGEFHPFTEAGKIAVILQVTFAVIFFAVMLGSIIGKFSEEINTQK